MEGWADYVLVALTGVPIGEPAPARFPPRAAVPEHLPHRLWLVETLDAATRPLLPLITFPVPSCSVGRVGDNDLGPRPERFDSCREVDVCARVIEAVGFRNGVQFAFCRVNSDAHPDGP